jgi:hypothetical protein
MKGTEFVGDPGRVEGGFDDWGPDGAGQSGGKWPISLHGQV